MCALVPAATKGTATAGACLDPPKEPGFRENRTKKTPGEVLVKAPKVANKCFPSALRGGPSPGVGASLQPHFGVRNSSLGWGKSIWELVPNEKML